MSGQECISLADIPEPNRPRLVRIDDCGVWLDVYPGGKCYFIEAERINDPVKLIRWIYHLAGKHWLSKGLIRDLIDALDEHCEWGLKGASL